LGCDECCQPVSKLPPVAIRQTRSAIAISVQTPIIPLRATMSISDYYSNARREVTPLLPGKFSSVLEIGCGEGNTLDWLRQEHGARVCCGIEIDLRASEAARAKRLTVVTADIERENVDFHGHRFDLILCLDVLEHLRDPWSALQAIATHYLNEGGYVIASIPNICHLSILSGLIFRDEWNYEEAGILDITHLRFFTRKTALKLFRGADLDVDIVKSRFSRKTHRNLDFLTFGMFRRFLTLQILVRGCKRAAGGTRVA